MDKKLVMYSKNWCNDSIILFSKQTLVLPTYDAGRIHICWGVLYVVTYLYSNVDIAQSSFFV